MMRRTLARGTLASCLAWGAIGIGPAAADDDRSDADLRARIAELEQTVAALRAEDEHWLTAQRAEEIRGIVYEVLADADTRSSLLQDGATAGWRDGFFIGSTDGNFSLNLSGQLQFRYIYGYQESAPDIDLSVPPDGIPEILGDDNRVGFENTRTKLIFTGHVVNPNWIYRIEGDFARSGGDLGLLDAYIGYVCGDSGWIFLAGQFKVPMLREELVDSRAQLAVERSLVNEEFTAGRTQGVALDYRNDWLHFTGGYTDGHPATGGFNMPALSRDTEVSLTARAEVLLDGQWSQFDDLTSWNGEEFGLLIGGAVHWQDGEYGTPDDEVEVLQWTVDASAEFGGANLFAYVVGRHVESSTIDLDQYGFVVQGGWFFHDDWEVFGRYEWGDDDFAGDDLSALTVGVNRYFARHQLKWTTDLGLAFNAVDSTWALGFLGDGGDIAGWRTDGADDGQLVFRTQLQLLF